jgi:hypothetical protein
MFSCSNDTHQTDGSRRSVTIWQRLLPLLASHLKAYFVWDNGSPLCREHPFPFLSHAQLTLSASDLAGFYLPDTSVHRVGHVLYDLYRFRRAGV